MARFLTYERFSREIRTLNTTTGEMETVGAAIAGLEVSSLWDGRARSVVAYYRGDAYVLARNTLNQIEVHRWDGTVMSLVAGPISNAGGGVLHPVCLQESNGLLYGVFQENGGASETRYLVTSDGVSWTEVALPATPVTGSLGGASAVWRQALFVASELGIAPINDPVVLLGPYDAGDDSGLADARTPQGSFATWNGDLYFLRPDTGSDAQLYKLDEDWSLTATPTSWTNQLATGLTGAGALVDAPDGGYNCLFRSRNDELVAILSGASGTVILKTDEVNYPAFTDITATTLPALVASLTNAGIALLEDDRRRTNTLQDLAIRDTALGQTYVFSWDGVSEFRQQGLFPTTVLMPSDDHQADLRAWTDRQPSVEFDFSNPPTQPFPGRVVLTYVLKDRFSRQMGVSPEYSEDGDEWLPMTEGESSDGTTALTSSPSGESHVFVWDAFNDLDGDKSNVQMRIVPRITGV